MKKMQTWIALTAVGVLAILAGGWFLLVSPKKAHASDLRDQADAQSRANMALQNQLASLKAAQKNLPAQQAKLAAVAAKIPGTSAMPTLVRALSAAADDAGVELVSITPSAPAALAASAPAAGTPSVTTAAAGTTTSTPATATTGVTPNAAAGAASVGTLLQIPVNVSVVGSYFQVAEYLDRLESLQRAFRVTTLSLTPGTNPLKPSASQPTQESGKVLTGTISGLVFQTQGASTATATTGK
ncbi:MAG: hypothetical protein JWO22_1761 [Frankiales bacterium]|nr:hypothetical protein [Frankiales bacterium]